MRIEILVENEEPQIFPLNKPKILIGANEACDIILNVQGISRKHISIINENDNFYVVDQGSTNGSYINEERLVPGRRAEFNSFFPVRLGDKVLITLLSDEEASQFGFEETIIPTPKPEVTRPQETVSDSTRTISLQELQAAKTQNLVKKRQEVVRKRTAVKTQKKKKAPPSDKSRMRLVQMICLMILGGAVYYNLYVQKTDDSFVAAPTPVTQAPRPAPMPVQPPKPKYTLVDEMDVVPKTRFESIEQNTMCVNDVEKYLCDILQAQGGQAVQSGTMIFVFADGQKFYEQAKKNVPQPRSIPGESVPKKRMKAYHDDLHLVTMVLFMHESFPGNFDPQKLNGYNLTIILKIPSEPRDYATAAITPDSLLKLLDVMDDSYLGYLKKYGPNTWFFFREFLRMDFNPLFPEDSAEENLATES